MKKEMLPQLLKKDDEYKGFVRTIKICHKAQK